MRARSVLLAAAVLAGCGGPPPAQSMDQGPLEGMLTMGTPVGMDGHFEPIAPGADAQLIEGAQGGFHVWVKFRLAGLGSGRYEMTRQAHRVSDGKIVLRVPASAIDVDGSGAWWESPQPLPMFMCPTPIGIRVVDEAIRYEIIVTTESGVDVARGETIMTPRCPAQPQSSHDFCERICVG